MVGVVVFPFIVNAAASCGPSPLGGIGTIGEGLSKMPIGSFTTAQSTGIMICTGVCALFMRFVTPMRPADLSDEDIRKEKEAEVGKEAKVSDDVAKAESDAATKPQKAMIADSLDDKNSRLNYDNNTDRSNKRVMRRISMKASKKRLALAKR
jgi:hypothetical protein